jgi:phosphoribosyl 1,2-cyclic phosphodiesterase
MVDAGKTLRDTVLKNFPRLNISTIDALLLTHGHADAMMGLDDLRDLQIVSEVRENGKPVGYASKTGPIRIISNAATLQRAHEAFPYLSTAIDFVKPGILQRRVAHLEWDEIDDDARVDICDVPVRSFPVFHGGTYISLGFAFGHDASFVYISDISALPDASQAYLRSLRGKIKVLVVDALRRARSYSHYTLDDALALVRDIRPEKTFLVGMCSCEMGDHDEVNAELASLTESEGLYVQLAYDGMGIPASFLNSPTA